MIDTIGMIRTNKGRALQAKVQAGLTTLQYTDIVFGAGRTTNDAGALTGLVDQKLAIPVQPSRVISDSEVQVTGVLTNDGLAHSFKVFELGVLALDPDEGKILYARAEAIDDSSGGTIPAGGSATRIEQIINLIVSVDDADKVIISPVGTDAYVLWEYFRLDQERQERECAQALEQHNISEESHPHLLTLLSEKMNSAAVYTKSQVDTQMAEKANKGKPAIYNLTGANTAISSTGIGGAYSKNLLEQVVVNVLIDAGKNVLFNSEIVVVGVLPTGFRPNRTIRSTAYFQGYVSGKVCGQAYVATNGQVCVGIPDPLPTGIAGLALIGSTITFVAEQ